MRQGRLKRPRLDLLLHYWLMMHEGRQITTHETFSIVQQKLNDGADAEALLASIASAATQFDRFERAPPTSVLGTFRYRVITVMQNDAVTPVLLWLYDPLHAPVPQPQRDRALAALESWLVRRMLCRMTTKDYNKVFVDLIQTLKPDTRDRAGEVVEDFLTSQTADSREWPTDGAIAEVAATTQFFRKLSRTRVRMVLEALEDHLRTDYSEQLVDRALYTIEHVLPQTWQKHWPLSDASPEKMGRRNQILHTFGNLTLVTKKLNPKLSNAPWKDKRETLATHTVLRLNHELLSNSGDAWSEDEILSRSQRIGEMINKVWPRSSTPAV